MSRSVSVKDLEPEKRDGDLEKDIESRKKPADTTSPFRIGYVKRKPKIDAGGGSPKEKLNEAKSGKASPISEVDDPNDDFDIAVLAREEDGEPYGFENFTPSFLQCCRRHPLGFLLVLCLLCIASSFIQHGAILASTTMWQRRFYFSTFDVASIRVMYDLGMLIMLIPAVYLDVEGVHRPQWLGLGGVVVGLGTMFMVIPHFVFQAESIASDPDRELCTNQMAPRSKLCNHPWGVYKAIFMLGELLIGMGVSSYWTMGVTYLDENVSPVQSGIYTAIFDVSHMIGPVLGFWMAGQAAKAHGDLDLDLGPTNLTLDHHEWYGAWWLVLMIGAAFSWIVSVFMFPFPAQLSGAIVAKVQRQGDAIDTGTTQEEIKTPESEMRVFMGKLMTLLRNRVLMGVVVEECFRNCMIVGISTFLTKYLQAAFSVDNSIASATVGTIVVSAALLGLMFGSAIQYLFRLDVLGNLRLCMAGAVATIIFTSVFFVHCPTQNFAGKMVDGTLELNDPCNQNCHCLPDHMEPICFERTNLPKKDKDKFLTYFSKCYAGCNYDPLKNETQTGSKSGTKRSKKVTTGTTKEPPECKCVKGEGKFVPGGVCKECSQYKMYAFLVGLGWTAAAIYVRFNSVKQILLRTVHFNHRHIAIALTEALTHLLNLPSPFIFAWILNVSCKKKTVLCDEPKTCVIYNRAILTGVIVTVIVLFSVICVGALAFSLYSYRQQQQQQQMTSSIQIPSKQRQSRKESISTNSSSSPRKASTKSTKATVVIGKSMV